MPSQGPPQPKDRRPRRTSLTDMLFPGRAYHRHSLAAAEKERASREEANRSSFLLKLPAELRNYIYELAVPRGRHVGISAPRDFIEQCPLLGVSRQLQAEVMPMFFGDNTFMILLRSLAKRHHHIRHKKPQRSFTEDAFQFLRSFQLVNNYLCRTGNQRLPHCLHLDGVVVQVDRRKESVEICPPMCSSGINLQAKSNPHPFVSSDDHPCFSACCIKSRKVAEERLVKEVKSGCLQFKDRKIDRASIVEVAKQRYEYG